MTAAYVPIFTVDSFTEVPFRGNPAGVCLLGDKTLSKDQYLTISKEMRHSETAFLTRDTTSERNNVFFLRWFTPTTEVSLCGHGTLAAASVLYNEEKIDAPELIFHTLSGDLIVKRSESGMLSMDFPKGAPKKIELAEDVQREVAEAVGLDPSRIVDVQFCATTRKLFVELVSVTDVEAARVPTEQALFAITFPSDIDVRGMCLVSPFFPEGHKHGDCDFASRYFSPWNGIPEDPVNGSSHTALGPMYAEKTQRSQFKAYAASDRSGVLWVEVTEQRTLLKGFASHVLRGQIALPQ